MSKRKTAGTAAGNEAVVHDSAARRFTTTIDGHQGYLEYSDAEGGIVIDHTVVPEPIGGRGVARRLVQAALEHARGEGLKIVPRCSYARYYFDRYPEHADLLA